MRHGRSATLLVALSLLTSAATAHAERVWVLWAHVLPRSGSEEHHLDSAYPTRQECEQAALGTASVLKLNGFTAITGNVPGSHEIHAEKGGNHWRFYCLPDTVDPRGPKGGAR